MRILVTGASGWIGSALVSQLLDGGHQVVGLVRSAESAAAVQAAGATPVPGSLADPDGLRAVAAASDGVVHLAFIHDFGNFDASIAADHRAIAAFGEALAGSDRPLVIASGVLGLPSDRLVTEEDLLDPQAGGRVESARMTMALAEHGVRSSVVRLAPTVHGAGGDHGFVAALVGIDRERGSSGYPGDGTSHWPAVHRLDAAALFRLAVEKAPAGSVWHGVAEEGVQIRDVAETIGQGLDLPVVSVEPGRAAEHFGWLGAFLQMDVRASNSLTRERLGWQPTHPTLIDDLQAGHYF